MDHYDLEYQSAVAFRLEALEQLYLKRELLEQQRRSQRDDDGEG